MKKELQDLENSLQIIIRNIILNTGDIDNNCLTEQFFQRSDIRRSPKFKHLKELTNKIKEIKGAI